MLMNSPMSACLVSILYLSAGMRANALESESPGFKAWFCYLLVMEPHTGHLLCLSFLICKKGKTIVSFSYSSYNIIMHIEYLYTI